MKRRALSILLVLSILLSLVPPVYATEEIASGTCGDNATWSLDSDGVLTISGSGAMADYPSDYGAPWKEFQDTICQVIIGEGIATVGAYSFYGYKNLTVLALPQTLTGIQESAFRGCEGLTEVFFPESVTTVGDSAFAACTQLTAVHISDLDAWCNIDFSTTLSNPLSNGAELLLHGEPVSQVVFPEGTEQIKACVFAGYEALQYVSLPESVTVIGNSAFSGCKNLQHCLLPDGLEEIGSSAFSGCRALQDSYIPDTVKTIGVSAFAYCQSFTQVVIPEGITTLNGTFDWCLYLETVVLPDSLTTIGDYTFGSCERLTNIQLPDNVTYLGTGAFCDAASLQTIAIPEGVTAIPQYAFMNCFKLESIRIPTSVTEIEEDAFYDCNEPSAVYYFGTREQWEAITVGAGNTALTNATIHYNCDQWTDLVDMGFTLEELFESPNLILDPRGEGDLDQTLANVTVSSAMGEVVTSERYMLPVSVASAQNVVLQVKNYRDYVIPASVAATMVSGSDAEGYDPYVLNAVLQKDQKDGKPYISTVFIRETGLGLPYKDARTTQYYAALDTGYDIVVSAVGMEGKDVTYYIGQNEARRVESTTGIFTAQQLADVFTYGKKIYAYAKATDGSACEPVELKLGVIAADDFTYAVLIGSKLSLYGSDGFKLSLPDSVPVLGGLEIGLNCFTSPIGVRVDGNRVRISVGFDLFSIKNQDGTTKPDFDAPWNSFKKEFHAISGNMESVDKALDRFKALRNKYSGSNRFETETMSFDIAFMGYMEGELVNGSLIFTDTAVTVIGKFSASHTDYFMAGPVPFYLAAGFDGTVSATSQAARIVADRTVPIDFSISLDVNPELWLEGGAGIRSVLSVGVYGKAGAPYHVNFSQKYHKWKLTGEVGIRAKLLLWSMNYVLLEGEHVLLDEYYDTSAAAVMSLSEENSPAAVLTQVEMLPRDYQENDSGWLGALPGTQLFANAVSAVDFRALQTGVFSETKPQLSQVGEQLVLTWIEDDPSRDDYNRMRLVYSLYDAQADTWSEPRAIYDDGCNDANATLAVCDGKLVIAWQKIGKVLTAEDFSTTDALLENAEIYVAVYDPAADAVSSVQRITENTCFDYLPVAAAIGAEPAVYYAGSPENDLAGSGSNLYCWIQGQGITVLRENIGFVQTMDALESQVAWVVDGAVYASSGAVDGSALRNAAMSIAFGSDGLYVTDGSNIYTLRDGVLTALLEEQRIIGGNLVAVDTDSGMQLYWMETGDTGNELCRMTCVHGSWTQPICISAQGMRVSCVDVVSYAGMLIGACNLEDESGNMALASFTVGDISNITLDDYFYFDESHAIPGGEVTFDVLLSNPGTTDVTSVTFTLTDTLGTSYVLTREVTLPSGSSQSVSLIYPVPANYAATTLTVTAEINAQEDADLSDNTAATAIGKCDLTIALEDIQNADGLYLISANVKNASGIASGNTVVCASVKSEEIRSIGLGTLEGGAGAAVELYLDSSALRFDSSGVAEVALMVTGDAAEGDPKDNTLIVRLIRSQNTCAHPQPIVSSVTEPDCLSQGYTEYSCSLCGDSYSADYLEALGHDYGYQVTAEPTEAAEGVLTAQCSRCVECFPVTLPALSLEAYTYAVITEPTYTGDGLGRYTWKETAYGEITVDVVLPDLTADVMVLELVCYPDKVFYSVGETLSTAGLSIRALREDGEVQLLTDGFVLTGFDSDTAGAKTVTAAYEGVTVDFTVAVTGESDQYGTCGTAAYWYCDAEALTLTVFGLGEMTDLSGESSQPWRSAIGMIRHVVICDGITSVGDRCFMEMYKLQDVSLGSSLMRVGAYAFFKNDQAVFTDLPDTVHTIERYAFAYCYALTELKIDGALRNIGVGAFTNCAGLIKLEVASPAVNIETHAFSNCIQLEEVTFCAESATLGSSVFAYCSSLKKLELGACVAAFGGGVFQDCYALEEVHVQNLETWCAMTFGSEHAVPVCYGAKLYVNGSLLEQLEVSPALSVIPDYAFYGYEGLTQLSFTAGEAVVGQSAFAGCTSLKTVDLGSCSAQFGKDAFAECSGLEQVGVNTLSSWLSMGFDSLNANPVCCAGELYVGGSRLEKLELPQGMTAVPYAAFAGCESLEQIVLPDSLTEIKAYAFYNCVNLMTAALSEQTEKIGVYAFAGCSRLVCVTIPASVTWIGDAAFLDCDALNHVLYQGTASQKANIDIVGGKYGSNGVYQVERNHNLKNALWHEQCTGEEFTGAETCSVVDWSCSLCDGHVCLTQKAVDDHSFEAGVCTHCGVLEALKYRISGYGDVAAYIEGYTGSDSSLVIPETIEGYGVTVLAEAFQDCVTLREVTVPDSCNVYRNAFAGCSNLEALTLRFCTFVSPYTDEEFQYPLGALFGENSYTKSTATLQTSKNASFSTEDITYYIPTSLKTVTVGADTIPPYAFMNCGNLLQVRMNEGVTKLQSGAFLNCSSLVGVYLPESLKSVASDALDGCTQFSHVLCAGAKNSEWKIDGLSSCEKLRSATWHYNATGEELVIRDSCSVTSVYCNICEAYIYVSRKATVSHSYEDGMCTKCGVPQYWKYTVQDNAQVTITGYTGPDTDLTVPEELEGYPVTSIGYGAFEGNTALTSIVFPQGITTIGSSALEGCSSLKTVALPQGITELANRTFASCTQLETVVLPGSLTSLGTFSFAYCSSLKEIAMPESLETIGESAFRGSGLETVTLPDTLTSMGQYAFAQCASLQSAQLGAGMRAISAYAFYKCETLTDVEIPENITHISQYAFYGCSSLAELRLGDGVTGIAQYAFGDCTSLENIHLGNSVTAIQGQTFWGCSALKQIVIPASVTSIKSQAFQGWTGAEALIFQGNAPTIQSSAFTGVTLAAYYPCQNTSWTQSVLGNYGGEISWTANHDYASLITPPGHLIDGYTTHTCILCGHSYTDTPVPAPGHAETVLEAVEPDCVSTGLTEGACCAVCGEILTAQQTVPALGHSWDAGVVTLEPTEDTEGIRCHTCTRCSEQMEAPIPSLDHVHSYEAQIILPGCSTIGFTMHSCRCGDTYQTDYVEPLGHTEVTDPAKAATCTEPGITEGSHCEVCGQILVEQEELSALGHVPALQKVSAATCTEAGYTGDTVCTSCAEVLELGQTLSPLGHTYVAILTQPTCVDAGYTTYTCNCGESYQDHILPATGHSPGLQGMRQPTCTEDGYTGDEVCTVCQAVLKTGETIAAVGHRYSTTVTPPTCVDGGYTTHTCNCGESYIADLTDPLGHDFGEWVRTKEPNYLEYGENTRYCSRCPETQTEPVNNNPFEDVGDGSRFKTAILWAYYTGVTRGTDATHFAPTAIVNRQQFVMFLWQAAGSPEPETGENPFTDVSPNNRFYKAILWASQNGITTGTGDGTTFSPTANCTRGQVVMFLYRYAGKPEIEKEVENPFTDVSVNNNFYKAILWAYSNNITSGKTATTFEIRSDCQRQHVVTFLYRYLEENK